MSSGTVKAPAGRPGNLTPEEEEKLRQLWQLIFQVFGLEPDEDAASKSTASGSTKTGKTDSLKGDKHKRKVLSVFSRKGKKGESGDSVTPSATSPIVSVPTDAEDDKYGQTKHFFETLAHHSPESIRATLWSMVKHDHPDALVLRFLRARKWDVEKALIMLISTMNWRAHDMHVDDDIMKNGEGAAAEAEKGDDPVAAKLSHDFLAQMRMGKSFLHGADKEGRPICIVRVRLHKQGEQVEESLERYTVYLIETARMVLKPPVDTATIIFDMTGFSMANMDYTPVKFMVKCFEANYPESLGAVLVHKAPWIFQGIWRIIRGWLDPVVAGKVHFTNSKKDMEEFIEPSRILKELDGDEDWEYQYVEPIPGENDTMKDTETRNRLVAAREQLYKDYEQATMEWIQTRAAEKAEEIKARRNAIATKLREDYWNLDPYIRARSYYDRIGVLQPGGKVEYYPTQQKLDGTAANGSTGLAVDTSADDVD
ncbi:hypothetical protein VTK73DRAFT_6814 [Phialemonium thermophilum]|uniref:CRAL-TRIO domain-containing protein n=1 Tax=Phialemonium thermophilum TaxID=223376 RepID=A0ABR3Y852_9PEZI